MAKNVINLNESELRKIIAESVRNILRESKSDLWDSGTMDYKGTGSEESKARVERMKQLRVNRSPDTDSPGKIWYKRDEKGDFTGIGSNDSTWKHTTKSFGGETAKGRVDAFKELVKPLYDKYLSMPIGSKAAKAFQDLYLDLYSTYHDWARKHDGEDFRDE